MSKVKLSPTGGFPKMLMESLFLWPDQTAPTREFLLQLSPSQHSTGYVSKTMIPNKTASELHQSFWNDLFKAPNSTLLKTVD